MFKFQTSYSSDSVVPFYFHYLFRLLPFTDAIKRARCTWVVLALNQNAEEPQLNCVGHWRCLALASSCLACPNLGLLKYFPLTLPTHRPRLNFQPVNCLYCIDCLAARRCSQHSIGGPAFPVLPLVSTVWLLTVGLLSWPWMDVTSHCRPYGVQKSCMAWHGIVT